MTVDSRIDTHHFRVPKERTNKFLRYLAKVLVGVSDGSKVWDVPDLKASMTDAAAATYQLVCLSLEKALAGPQVGWALLTAFWGPGPSLGY